MQKLSKLLSKEFRRSVYSNKYKVIPNRIVEIAAQNAKYQIRELLDSIGKELKDCLFLLIIIKNVIIKFLLILIKKYFLPRVKIESYNIKIDGRNFYDQSINDSIKQYDEI